jgi:hypothetical protein
MKKAKKVVVTVELETVLSQKELKELIEYLLDHIELDVKQIQINTVK